MRQSRSRRKLIALVSLVCAMQSVSSRSMAEARQECVGRYELTIPGDADVALTIPTAFSQPQENPIRSSDVQPAARIKLVGAAPYQPAFRGRIGAACYIYVYCLTPAIERR